MQRVWMCGVLLLAACSGGDDGSSDGMSCDAEASLCGTLDSPTLATPVRCAFGAIEVNEFVDPPEPDSVWDAGYNAFVNEEVDQLPFDFAINDLDFWDGAEMYVAIVCDSNDDGQLTAEDAQGLYGGDVADTAVVPSTGIDITL